MIRDLIRQICVSIATIVLLLINTFADIVPINGVTTGRISKVFDIYFSPAGYTFAIWALIYLGLLAYTIFQALPSQKENPVLRKIGWWYIGGSISFSAWMVFWQYQMYVFTMMTMIGLLVTLLVIYEKIEIGSETKSRGMRFLVQIPFSIYMAWITMATIANITEFLHHTGWNAFGISPRIWTVALIVLTVVIAELTAFNRQDLVYLAVFVWSFIGIAIKNIGVSPVFEAASVAAGFVVIMAIITIVFKSKTRKRA